MNDHVVCFVVVCFVNKLAVNKVFFDNEPDKRNRNLGQYRFSELAAKDTFFVLGVLYGNRSRCSSGCHQQTICFEHFFSFESL